ncbi:hypothetical protein TspCOW1_07380 [Thiohalobacter sp. COW1]|uniref:hypothetical protein n=1 Tax=Thiohalobacter sp. COW1 TaxID=2795687 RepID=UPI0019152EED|nr:hypothetical protein [Thiohalobacter sp. COW1]BCO30635.1 hypothetical protein TspCOW1_07380 [Thiohalobacter sp. COW1]
MTQIDEKVIEEITHEIMTRIQFRRWPAPEVAIALARAAGALAGRAASGEETLTASVSGLAAVLGDQAAHDFADRNTTSH